MKKLGILLIALVGFTTVSFAQPLSATTNASATIVGTLTIANAGDMTFGNMTSPVGASTVTLDAASVATPLGGVALLGGITPAAAKYHVTGTATATYTITLPNSAVTLAYGAITMTIDNFVSSYAGTSNIGTIKGSATDDFTVGARLNVGAGQAPGKYEGTYDVSIAYN
jgi:hypothetical protein